MSIAGLCLQVEPIVSMTTGWKISICQNLRQKISSFQAPPLHSIFVPPDFPAQAVPDLLKRYILLFVLTFLYRCANAVHLVYYSHSLFVCFCCF